MTDAGEYLLSYGTMGELGRFQPVTPLACRRGDRVVIRSQRGLEIGVVLCEAGPQKLIEHLPSGQLLRLADRDDLEADSRVRQRGRQLFEDARREAVDLGLPLEVLDVELTLDGTAAVIHYLKVGDGDPRPFMDRLADKYHLRISLHDVAPVKAVGPSGCGSGGCGACGSAGGCGSCSAAAGPPLVSSVPGRVPVFST